MTSYAIMWLITSPNADYISNRTQHRLTNRLLSCEPDKVRRLKLAAQSDRCMLGHKFSNQP